MFGIVVLVFSSLILLATALAQVPGFHWTIRVCDFPRVQFAVAGLIALVLAQFVGEPCRLAASCVAGLAVFWQMWHVLPYTPFWPSQVKSFKGTPDPGNTVRLLISNVLTPNRNSEALISQIHTHSPDIVLTLESDDWWQEKLDEALLQDWPHCVRIPLDNLYGMHMYSRLPLGDPQIKWLIQDDIPSIHCWLTLGLGRVRLHAVHPRPPAPAESTRSLWRDGELLLVGKDIYDAPGPTLVFGDLNDVAWSRSTRTFCRLSGMLDPRRGRGMYSTFNAFHRLLRWPLDHVFVSEHFELKSMQRLKPIGSDHFPILAELVFQPGAASKQDNPEASQDEWDEAQETIRQAKQQSQKE